jgi:hypothetical protein
MGSNKISRPYNIPIQISGYSDRGFIVIQNISNNRSVIQQKRCPQIVPMHSFLRFLNIQWRTSTCVIFHIIICNHVLDPNGSVMVSFQRYLGLPTLLRPLGVYDRNCLGNLSGSILSTCFFH